ncbi:MAG: hypothetical protein ACE5OZ_03030 [Candidatus Heimdallarchaeota archaeon]
MIDQYNSKAVIRGKQDELGITILEKPYEEADQLLAQTLLLPTVPFIIDIYS